MYNEKLTRHPCSTCKGKKYVIAIKESVLVGIGTLGLLTLVDLLFRENRKDSVFAYKCKDCNGSGFEYR